MVHLSTGDSAATPHPPARLGNGQPASPMRLMACRPHADLFISCFQNDISLATADQRAWWEQRGPVSWSRTNTGQENMPRSRQADRQGHHGSSFDLSVYTEVCWSGSSGWGDIDGLFWRLPVYRGDWQGAIVFLGPQAGPHCTNVD